MQRILIHLKVDLFVKSTHLHPGYAANLVARSRYYHCHWTVLWGYFGSLFGYKFFPVFWIILSRLPRFLKIGMVEVCAVIYLLVMFVCMAEMKFGFMLYYAIVYFEPNSKWIQLNPLPYTGEDPAIHTRQSCIINLTLRLINDRGNCL